MHIFFSELLRTLLVFRLVTLRPATISFQAHNLASTQADGFSRDQPIVDQGAQFLNAIEKHLEIFSVIKHWTKVKS